MCSVKQKNRITARSRVEGSTESASSSSQTTSSRPVPHTVDETLGDTGVSNPLHSLMDMAQPTKAHVVEAHVSGIDEVWILSFTLSVLTPLESSGTVQAENNTLLLAICRTQWANQRLPKHFQDILPEPPLPLPPQDAEVSPEVNTLQMTLDARSSATTVTPSKHPQKQTQPLS